MADEDAAPDYEVQALECHSCRATKLAAGDMAGNDKPDPLDGIYFHTIESNGHQS